MPHMIYSILPYTLRLYNSGLRGTVYFTGEDRIEKRMTPAFDDSRLVVTDFGPSLDGLAVGPDSALLFPTQAEPSCTATETTGKTIVAGTFGDHGFAGDGGSATALSWRDHAVSR